VNASSNFPVTVVIASRNRRDLLLATLGRLRMLPERPPLIVVDDASEDGSADAVRAAVSLVEVVALAAPAGAAARNVGVQIARTQMVAFADDDSWFAPGALAAAAAVFATRPRLGLLAARILVGPERRLDPTCRSIEASKSVDGFLACGAVVRRGAFLAAGGFHPWMSMGGEEERLAIDVAAQGWELDYDRAVVVHHHPPRREDPAARRRAVARNAAWTDWLRRPASEAARRTVRRLAREPQPAALAGVLEAVVALPWLPGVRRPAGS
jgi:glycosyltransferase involved in cell wall biosynthesis